MLNYNLKLIEDLNEFNLKSLIGLGISGYKKYKDYTVAFNNKIKDEFWNYITNIKINNIKDFEQIIKDGGSFLKNKDRKITVAVMPFMEEIYENRDQYFQKEYELISNEVWQIYDEFEILDNMEVQCDYDIVLEKTENMNLYADELVKMYRTENDNDPYGNLDSTYKEVYSNFRQVSKDIYNEFYLVKINNEIVGLTGGAFDKKYYSIHSLVIKEKYRGQGIGKKVIKKQLKIAKDRNIKLVVLQTEEGYYPANLYRKIGFKDLCYCYYYTKRVIK